jgi:thiol-disulfide isomerase/thioredoxin
MASTPRIIAAAAVLGLAAGAVAVYVTGGPAGNMAAPEVSAPVVAGAHTPACAAKADQAQAIGAAATGQVAAMLPADPPQSLQELSFNGPDGAPLTLADFSGKAVLLNLWATWCAPCRAEMPALDRLQEEMGGDDFEVVAVNVDAGSDDKPQRFLAETEVDSLAYYRDASLGVFNELKSRGLALGLPVTLLIDEDGCLLGHMNGPAEWASEDAKRLVGLVVEG